MKILDQVREFRKAQRVELLHRRLEQIKEMREELEEAEADIRAELTQLEKEYSE